jgi:hypothetical protein
MALKGSPFKLNQKGTTMNTTQELTRMELTSDCTCVMFDEDENEMASDECFGCWTDDLDYFKSEFLGPFLDAHDLGTYDTLKLDATNFGWRRETVRGFTASPDLISMLTIRGDFTLRITLSADKRELTITRSSHDELGARFVITPASEED